MALEINPSATTALLFVAFVAFVFVGLHTTGALLSLAILAAIIIVITFIVWALGKRIARRGAGLGR